jgi:TPR repeat protein
MYGLARWTENHNERIGEFILWPFEPDVLGGYAWLEKAAAKNYPPAVYAVGVRLKHGIHVPRPPGWNGPAGNRFPQPQRGQALIDRALQLGYRPLVEEQQFYSHFRR